MAERVMSDRITAPTIDAVERCVRFAAAQAREAGFSLARVREIELGWRKSSPIFAGIVMVIALAA